MTKILSNKSTYEGEFKDNEPHAKGLITLPNGNVQKGKIQRRKSLEWNLQRQKRESFFKCH